MVGPFLKTSSQFLAKESLEMYLITGQPKVGPCLRTSQIYLTAMWTTGDLQTIKTFNMKNQHFKGRRVPWDTQ